MKFPQPVLRSPSLPLAMLLLALSTVFIFGGERGHFYRGSAHDLVSAEHLTVAVNRSFEHGFAGFHNKTLDEDGDPTYHPYNRFPMGGYLIIKLATLPFSGSLSGQIAAARILMLLFFAAAAVMTYLSLSRLVSNRWIALTATLLGFSSYYLLYYNDMIATEVTVDLFGVMLTFHGMVVFVQEGRFRQLLIKTCIALLLGWHVLALLLPFVILGLASELVRTRPADASSPHASTILHRGRHMAAALLHSRYVLLGIVALGFGLSVLTLNFAVEYAVLDGETPLTELPSFKSILVKILLNQLSSDTQGWRNFLEMQFYRIGGMSLPYSYFTTLGNMPLMSFKLQQIITASIVTGVCLIGSMFVRQRILFVTLASFGFFWALPTRYSTSLNIHDFESIYYVGIPLVFFALVLMYIRKLSSDRLIVGAGIAAMLVFTGSSFQMARAEYVTEVPSFEEADSSEFHETMLADFNAIRHWTNGKVVFVPGEVLWFGVRPGSNDLTGVWYGAAYYLSGSTILYSNDQDKIDFADFVVRFGREYGDDTLTPENQLVFLYHREDYDGVPSRRSTYNEMKHGERTSDLSDPIIESKYNVYLRGNYLVYARDGACIDTHARFFLHVTPRDEKALLYPRRIHGFENRDFHFDDMGWENEAGCFAVRSLPRYDIAQITTGQYRSSGLLWREVFEFGSRQ